MKTIQVELTDKVAAEIRAFVKTGWFGSEAEVVRAALRDFVRRNRAELAEGFMCEDIRRAVSQEA